MKTQSSSTPMMMRRALLLMLLPLTQPMALESNYGSYVILGEGPSGNNVAIARTVIDTNETCPTVSEVGSSSTINMISRDNPNHFSVLVCEALVAFDTQYNINFSTGAVMLPIAKSNPQNILVYGDTGCSDCAKGTAAEPFKTMADAGAAENADLVLHMGDYNYRGTSGATLFSDYHAGQWQQQQQYTYDAGDGSSKGQHCNQVPGQSFYSQSASNSNRPDIWENWQDDVFLAAGKLMASAPWIVARGNHELCSRAGPGYFYFLDPSSRLTGAKQLSCPVPELGKDAQHNTLQIPNYVVSFEHLDIAVIDSANACDNSSNSPFTQTYKKVFNDLANDVGPATTWLMTHRPLWGAQSPWGASEPCYSGSDLSCVNQMMQAALKQTKSKSLPPAVELVFSGHMHLFESVSFPGSKRPPNIVVGSSGVKLIDGAPFGAVDTTVDGLKASLLSTSESFALNNTQYKSFGYMSVSVAADGSWQSQLLNPYIKTPLVTCSSQQNLSSGVCQLGSGITAP